MKYDTFYSTGSYCPQNVPRPAKPVFNNRQKWHQLACILICSIFLLGTQAVFANGAGKIHEIELWAEKIPAGAQQGGNDLFAYRMAGYIIKEGENETDVTSRYVAEPTIPGPTIVIDEGDKVALTLRHKFDPGDSTTLDQVSVHVHGVHYTIEHDGTIEYINKVLDESATPVMSYTYHWDAAPGTAGTWAYHDHNMITLNGAEDRGLFGALIVNNKTSAMALNKAGQLKTVPISSIKKEYILFIGDDAFWGTEVNNQTGQQTPLGDNPVLSAQQGSNVRFHLIALGTNTHNFKLNNYGWIDPGTNLIISEKVIGPLEKHVFAVQAGQSSQYKDDTFSSNSLGMNGDFNVIP
ncbi:MAG: multicopper oxidase domain-containing protein [Burkholderiales bacterium]|nr:multicopper oxidase domain-containing protein [Nitrosomonas sp.]MCP5275071.1 multicopper oxidase domain-containing protein [Burkholderiales bacterium]